VKGELLVALADQQDMVLPKRTGYATLVFDRLTLHGSD
jgi:hypothetical protein